MSVARLQTKAAHRGHARDRLSAIRKLMTWCPSDAHGFVCQVACKARSRPSRFGPVHDFSISISINFSNLQKLASKTPDPTCYCEPERDDHSPAGEVSRGVPRSAGSQGPAAGRGRASVSEKILGGAGNKVGLVAARRWEALRAMGSGRRNCIDLESHPDAGGGRKPPPHLTKFPQTGTRRVSSGSWLLNSGF
jgi:hypothetical protein